MWNTADVNCSPFNQPVFTDDPGGYFDWYETCTSPVPPLAPDWPAPPCEVVTVYVNANCFWQACSPAGRPTTIRCVDPEAVMVETPEGPHISAMVLRTDGADLLIRNGRRDTAVSVPHGAIKLANLARAMLHMAPLPSAEIKDIPADFWEGLPEITVDRRPGQPGGAATARR